MTNFALLAFCAVAVSIDSFVVGFGISLNKKGNLSLPSAVALATLALCLVTSLFGVLLQKYLLQYVDLLGAVLLFTIGVCNLLKEQEQWELGYLSLRECFAVGFTVGLDGAVANMSLVADGFGLVAPLTITTTHFVTVLLGQLLANKVKIANTNVIAGVTLMILALVKLL